jgi:putative peptide zinc metalloprotease protein
MTQDILNSEIVERLRSVHTGLRADLEISRHIFHGDSFYVVRDPVTFQSHTVSAIDYQILIRLNKSISLGEVFETLTAQGTLTTDREKDFFGFILTLQHLGFLHLPITNGKVLYKRYQQRQDAKRRGKLLSFLFVRVPLVNPDAFLDRTVKYVRPLFTRFAFACWVVVMCACGLLFVNRWNEFISPVQSVLAARNLLLLGALLVGLKVLHELGHAYACKVFGGKVPEMGAFFILFTPCAYVDASAAWGFPNRIHRIIVSLAGMYIESMIAACALLVWSWTSPSFLHSCAHHVILLAGVMTFAMNLNPLMRYDGYYVLSDLLNIPNLRSRSYTQVAVIFKRLVLGVRQPQNAFRLMMRITLFVYGVAAIQYRVVLVLAICAIIAFKFHIPGLVAAALYLSSMLLGNIKKLTLYLWKSPETAPVRRRAVVLSLIVLIGIPLGLMAVPFRRIQHLQGVVVAEDETRIYAAASGFMTPGSAKPGTTVVTGDAIFRLENIEISGNVRRAEAELELLRLQSRIEQRQSRDRVSPSEHKVAKMRTLLEQANKDSESLIVRSPADGTVIDVKHTNHSGQFIKQGNHVATLIFGQWMIRCLATAENIADMQARVGKPVRIRILANLSHDIEGTIFRISEMGSKKIESLSLTQLGHGTIPVSPLTQEASEPYYQIFIQLADNEGHLLRHGMIAQVCYESNKETYGNRFIRSCRQFISSLSLM